MNMLLLSSPFNQNWKKNRSVCPSVWTDVTAVFQLYHQVTSRGRCSESKRQWWSCRTDSIRLLSIPCMSLISWILNHLCYTEQTENSCSLGRQKQRMNYGSCMVWVLRIQTHQIVDPWTSFCNIGGENSALKSKSKLFKNIFIMMGQQLKEVVCL